MYEVDENGVSRVPVEELEKFAYSLFSYLYFYFNMQSTIVITSDYFEDVIGLFVFLIERITYKFNVQFVSDAAFIIQPLQLCQNVCNSYADDNYFKKLYYVSSFISHYAYWRHCALQRTDFSMGPALWMDIFQTNFESRFEGNGGWQAFADAGMISLQTRVFHPNDFVSQEQFLEDTFLARVSLAISLRPRNDEISPNELAETFEDLSIYSELDEELEEVEHGQQAQVAEEINLLPVEPEENVEIENPLEGTSEETRDNVQQSPSRINERKRRRGQQAQDDDDINPVLVEPEENVETENPLEGTSKETRENIQGSPGRINERKRRREPVTKDSDSEHDTEKDDPELKSLSDTPKRKKVQFNTPPVEVSKKSEESLQKTPRKRRHDSATKDSDKELHSPSTSKMGKK